MTDAAPVAELRDVVVDYSVPGGKVRAIDRVSLSVAAGSSLALLGRSGSGKSSLVAVLGLMRTPTSGDVLIDGTPIQNGPGAQRKARAATVGMVFQSFHLEPHLTATENCMMAWYFGSQAESRKAARGRAQGLVELVGLGHLSSRRISEMSGGERQRVAIARALFTRPRLLIADEPTGNLDEETASLVSQLLWDLPAHAGAGVVVVTHDAAVAAGASQVLRLAKGQIVAEGDKSASPEAI